MDGWMDETYLGFVHLDMLEMCNMLTPLQVKFEHSKDNDFPIPVGGIFPSTLRLKRLGNRMKSKSAILTQE